MAELPIEVLPSDLRFRFQLNKQLLATITITNPNAQRVAFKIKTTAPKKYVVRPSSGVVEARSNVSIQVIMQAQKEYAPEFANCKDKFMVQTTLLGETEQIEKDTFSKEDRKDMKEYRLRVTIEGPAAPPSPVPEANEGADDEAAARSAAAAASASSAPPPAIAPSAPAEGTPVDSRLRTAMDNLVAATGDNQQLKSQVDRLQREREEMRRQLDAYQLQQGAKVAAAAPAKAAAKPQLLMIQLLLVAIIAFVLGHYVRF
ncbi:Vesicle-associated protein 1-1 [Tetrabaena socialis]|uniref:Vesicle-associated protein 1-1 n=1 Tax=Tetrabaena socialis TaxID=47790 RepID=A0A2J8AID5_9CHLO|nr:Vesicle-associated protein 1-1 [Tetrabaena socialis]|eukprot:PNH12276.1 Vesicle-associated protein 1-1 [Tetrabaena socialis]